MHGDGRAFQKRGLWWIALMAPQDGKRVEQREPAYLAPGKRAMTEVEANRCLRARRAEVLKHDAGVQQFVGKAGEKIRFAELLDKLEQSYRDANGGRGRASLPSMLSHAKPVRAFFGEDRARAVTDERLWDYVRFQRTQGYSEASIKRQLEFIRRAFNLSRKKLAYIPEIPILKIDNVRQGFTDKATLQKILGHLDDTDVRDFIEWFFWTGMRPKAARRLTWKMVDRDGATWSLYVPAWADKAGKGFTLPLKGGLGAVINRRQQARRPGLELVFHRGGAPMGEFRKTWKRACALAGVPDVWVYDLKRTASRNMRRAGVPQHVMMRIMAHSTDSMFRRYNIVDDQDVADAMEAVAARVGMIEPDLGLNS